MKLLCVLQVHTRMDQMGSFSPQLTASSNSFPVLFFPGDFVGEGEGDGRGAESVSSCSISFSNFINPGGSTPNLLETHKQITCPYVFNVLQKNGGKYLYFLYHTNVQ